MPELLKYSVYEDMIFDIFCDNLKNFLNTGVNVLHNIVRDPRVRLISSGLER